MEEILLDLHGAVYVGILCFLLGFLIRVPKWTFLVAGYNPSSDIPDSVVATLVGNFMLRVGLATGIYGVVLTELRPSDWLGPAFAVLVVLATFRLIYRLNTYEHPGQSGACSD